MNPLMLSELARERRANVRDEFERERLARLIRRHFPMRDRIAVAVIAVGMLIVTMGARIAGPEPAETPDCA